MNFESLIANSETGSLVIARSEATKLSRGAATTLACFASLAMTGKCFSLLVLDETRIFDLMGSTDGR